MATKKTNTKKATAKASPKAAAKKPAPKAKAAQKAQTPAQALKSLAVLPTIKQSGTSARRPTPNPPLSDGTINLIANAFNGVRDMLQEAAANIRPLDRSRLNGVGIKKQGFIERTYAAALENQQFMPQYLTIDKFRDDFQYFVNLRTIFEACTQLREFIWNLTIQGADITYTDALEFYAAVREAASRRIDGAETVHRDLEPFFKSRGNRTGQNGPAGETKKQLKREFNALERGTRDGKIVIENIKPKITAGIHKAVDERLTDSAKYRDTEQGEIDE